MKIEDCLTCPHTIRVLRRAGIETMEALAGLSREDLLKLRGIGPVIAGDVEKKICEWKQNEKSVAGGSGGDHPRAVRAVGGALHE